MRIDQLVHTLSYGDAISNEAIAIKRLMRESGIDSTIYVVNVHELLRAEAVHFSELGSPGDAVILHYSIASPLNELFRGLTGPAKLLIYHNLTPERWFRSYNARVVADLRVGRCELPELLGLCDIVLADSEYNRGELDEMGCSSAQVLPLFIDERKWSVSPNSGITAALRGHGGVNVLHAGRLAPNKCVEDIIKAFYFYHHKINERSRLWLVGSDIDTEIYSFELKRLISELRLKEAVTFTGTVADSELKAFYAAADVYVCMSEHEGFCVPLLEAMYLGVPVIAYKSTAVPATLGGAGLLLNRKAPAETAELINLLVTDRELRGRLVEAGRARAREFSESAFKKLLEPLVLDPIRVGACS